MTEAFEITENALVLAGDTGSAAALKAVFAIADAITLRMQQTRHARSTDLTLGRVFEEFINMRNLKPNTVRIYTICFALIADWQGVQLQDVRKQMIVERHALLSNRNGPKGTGATQANQTMRMLRALFNFAIGYYESGDGSLVLENNPVQVLSAVKKWNRIPSRRGMLLPHQFCQWFAGVAKLRNASSRDLLVFLLFTGLRKNEAITLRWCDVDFQGATFTVRDTKNGLDHTLPLSDYLYNLLLSRWELSGGRPYVFGGRKRNSHLHYWDKGHENVAHLSGIRLCHHDLRRSFVTVADSIGIQKHVIKALINHKPSDVTDQYLIMSTERLREPMQMITDRMLDYAKSPPQKTRPELVKLETRELEPLSGPVEARILELVARHALCSYRRTIDPSVTIRQIHKDLWSTTDTPRTEGSTSATMRRLEKRGYLTVAKTDKHYTKHYTLSSAAKVLLNMSPSVGSLRPGRTYIPVRVAE